MWTLAACEFECPQKNLRSPAASAAAVTLPQLLLGHLTEGLSRLPGAQEQLDRKVFQLRKDRVSLFLQLSKEVQTRDAVMLHDYSERVLASKIREADRKILEIQKKIDESLAEEEKEKEKFAPLLEREQERGRRILAGDSVEEDGGDGGRHKFASLLRSIAGKDSGGPAPESVVLYKNDFSQLFAAGEEIQEQGYDGYSFGKAVTDAGIQGLITGKITVYGDYISASAQLYLYPGARAAGGATEVGSISDLNAVAENLARALTPKIAESVPVELTFDVRPEEAAANITITIDDFVYKSVPESLVLPGGVHSVTFGADGFSVVSTSYSFTGARKFHVEVTLEPESEGSMSVRLKKMFRGDLYGNGIFYGSVDEENRAVSMKVNSVPVLGRFISEDGSAADFLIPAGLQKDGAFLRVNAKPFDRSAYIEKRRRRMYTSYSILIVSLMPTFYACGTYAGKPAAYKSGYIDYDNANSWRTASIVTAGISIGCACLFVYNLVRYLAAANTVLPAEARPIGGRELERLGESFPAAYGADSDLEAALSETDGAEAAAGESAGADAETAADDSE